MSSPTTRPPTGVAFDALDACIRQAVELVASTDPNPTDPFRGLYISDDLAVSLAREGSGGELDAQLGHAGELLGLDELEAAVLALCAAPELSPHYGRLYAYLHDDVTRKLASPRLLSRLLSQTGISAYDVIACFHAPAALRRSGAIVLLDGGGQTPLAERLVKVDDRLAAFLIGSRLDASPQDGRLRRVDVPVLDPGRSPVIDELRSLVKGGSRLPVVVAGPDAPTLLAAALEQGLALVDVADATDAEFLRHASISATLEGRQLCFDGLELLEPDKRPRIQRALEARVERTFVCAKSRDAVGRAG